MEWNSMLRTLTGVLWLASAAVANAQLGMQQAECEALWGQAVSVIEGAGGMRTLVFSNAAQQVEAGFVDGVAERLVYRDLAVEMQDIPNILAANAGGQSWNRWSGAQSAGQTGARREWMRSDEMAMAVCDNRTMTVIGGRWNPAQQAAVQASQEVAASGDGASEASNGASNALAPSATSTLAEQPPAAPAAIAEPKAPRPDVLPSKGDSRDMAIRILGLPPGSLRNGNREILSYAWGYVCMMDGKVVSIE